MESVRAAYNDTIHSGIPEFRDWFIFSHEAPVMFLIISYFLFVEYVGPAMMKDKKPIKMPQLMFLYNFIVVLIYMYNLYELVEMALKVGWQSYCRNYYDEGVKEKLYNLVPIIWNNYMVKLIELLDTVFMVLMKKNNSITKMHVLHHCLVPVYAWYIIRSETGSYIFLFVVVNAVVHIIMYTYYAIAVLGPKYRKYIWWKRYLTTLQILQFALVTAFLAFAHFKGCTTSKFIITSSVIISILFFYLFIDYYVSAFFKNKKLLQNASRSEGRSTKKDK